MCTGKNILLMPLQLPGICLGYSNDVAGEMEIIVYDKGEDRTFKMTAHPRDLKPDPTPHDEHTPGDDVGRMIALDILIDLALLTHDKQAFEDAQTEKYTLKFRELMDNATGKVKNFYPKPYKKSDELLEGF